MTRPGAATRAIAIAAAFAGTDAAADVAQFHVVVLPLDGNAPPEIRLQLAAELADAARASDRDVTDGTTTFREAAAADGCDPDEPACATAVLAALGVDEIIYGTATANAAATHVQLARVARDRRDDHAFDLPASGDPAPEVRLLFAPPAPPAPPAPAPAPPVAPARSNFFDTRDRKLGVALIGTGALAALIGVAVWASESSLQTSIDNAPIATLDDITALRALEHRASDYALGGNLLVALGLAAGAVGGYYLWSDHRARAIVAPTTSGAAVVIEGQW